MLLLPSLHVGIDHCIAMYIIVEKFKITFWSGVQTLVPNHG